MLTKRTLMEMKMMKTTWTTYGCEVWRNLTAITTTTGGHRVTALDLGASGVRPEKLFSDEVRSFFNYSQPLITLMESLPPNLRLILVGHTYGGMSISLAMEKFPEKIKAVVFVAAFMPDCSSLPSYPLKQVLVRKPPETFLDSKFEMNQGPEKVSSTTLIGPICLSMDFYQNSAQETTIGGGGGDIGKRNSHGGGDGGDDGGDDDYFGDFEEGDEGGLFQRRLILQEVG